MQASPLPLTRDLVFIGGGHAHALVLRDWAMRPLPGVRVTVINPDPVAPYTGMLPGHIAGHYPRAALMIDMVRLARLAGARLILDRAMGLDPSARLVHLAGRPPVAYDVASVDIGIGSGLPDLPGAQDHLIAAKPLGPYAARWEAFLDTVRTGRATPEVVVIGAGVGGVELALAMAHRMRHEGIADPQVHVLEQADRPLPAIGAGARAALLAHCARLGVRLHLSARPVRVGPDAVDLSDGRRLAARLVIGVAGAQPQAWLSGTGLAVADGFLTVSDTLQTSDPAVFAAGDCAHMAHAPRPKAGVYAVRQAPVLGHNLRAVLSGGPLRRYQPQRDYLKLISTGGKGAVADKWGLRLDGAALWRWKDRIDRRFMAMFHDLPPIPAPRLPDPVAIGVKAEVLGTPPLCGGCGGKVAGGALRAGLAGLPAPRRADVLVGAGDDAAVLAHGSGSVQVLTTDSLRAFVDDPWMMGRITALHALGDVLAMGAKPQAALAQITLPRASQAIQGRMLAEVLAGAIPVLTAAGADLVGGHSLQGDALSVGFTVTGLAPRALTKAGGRPGDALILTRPIGSGTILAAEMAMRPMPDGSLLGEVFAGCLAAMQRPGQLAAGVLADRALAMTDVTGFGLAGHLWDMLVASGCRARLDPDRIPLLPGAAALAADGVRAHLAQANRDAVPASLPDTPLGWLLSDPQTAGGFLAAVPPDAAAEVLAALHAAGETDASVIGLLEVGPPDLGFGPVGA